MIPDIPGLLADVRRAVPTFTPDWLAKFFQLPAAHFQQPSADTPILFRQAGASSALAYALRGTIFWPSDKQIVRGLPRVLRSADQSPEAASAHNDRAVMDALGAGEGVIETKEPGIAVRLYARGGATFFATDCSHDASNPLIGTGVENPRALGIDVASQARRLCQRLYPRAAKLAALGYVPVFALLLPERETFVAADRPDLVLIDVVDPDNYLVDRLEKERIAEDYGLSLVAQHGRITGIANPASYYARLRALELSSAQSDGPGFLVKARATNGDQIAVRAEPAASRGWAQAISDGDLNDAWQTLSADCPTLVAALTDAAKGDAVQRALTEEMILEYLGNRRRNVRWRVAEWIESQIHAKPSPPLSKRA